MTMPDTGFCGIRRHADTPAVRTGNGFPGQPFQPAEEGAWNPMK